MQSRVQRGQPAGRRLGGGGYYGRIAQIAVDQRLGVVQFDVHPGSSQQLRVPDAVIAEGAACPATAI